MYTFESRIRYSETDSEGKLTIASLLNYFQDCSTFQSEDLGRGVEFMKQKHRAWVLCSWQVEVERYPKLGERVTIGTFPYDFKGFLGYRNFVMLAEDGGYLAKANSLWTLLDTDTGKLTAASPDFVSKYVLEERLDMEYASRKIALPKEGAAQEPIVVQKHHLDTNHHVNNGQYVVIAENFLPEHFEVKGFRAEYKKQAFLDDVFYPYVETEEGKAVVALKDAEGKPYFSAEFQGKESVQTDD